MKNSKVFRKLFIVYIVIVVMYTFAVATVFFYKNNEIVNLELNNNQRMFLKQAVERIDTQIIVALNMVQQFKVSEELIDYARSPESNYYQITRLYNNLGKKLDAFNNFGYTLDITKTNEELVITSGGTLSRDKYYKSRGMSEADIQDVETYMETGKSGLMMVSHTLQAEIGNLITMVKKESISSQSEVVFFISFYEPTFLPQLDSEQSGFGILNDHTLMALNSTLDQPTIDRLLAERSKDAGLQEEREYVKSSYSDYELHSRGSDVLSNITYLFITPHNGIQTVMLPILLDSFVIYFILLVVGVGLSFLAARNMYQPIHNLVAIFKGYEGKTNQDEFDFIRESALQITESNESLRETLTKNRLPLKNKFLRDLIIGIIPNEQIKAVIDKYELHVLKQPFTVVVIEFADKNLLEEQFAKDAIQEIISQTMRIFEEQMKLAELECVCFEWDHKRNVLIIRETDVSKMKKLLGNAIAGIEIDFQIRIVAAIGQPTSEVQEIGLSFQAAMQLMEQRIAVDKRAVFTPDDLGAITPIGYYYPLELERDLISYVIQGKTEQVQAILLRIFDENVKRGTMNGEALSQFIYAMMATINRILQQLNKTAADFLDESTFQYSELKLCTSTSQLQMRFEHIFQTIIDTLKSASEEKDHTIADQMIAFVHEHYSSDLSLTELAEEFNFSPGYISILFKNYVGANFKDYLNIYRMRKAKEILNGPGKMTVNEVSEMVGFNHVNTFIRLFKKYEGVSPGQYARKND